jgi:hypothetical protein
LVKRRVSGKAVKSGSRGTKAESLGFIGGKEGGMEKGFEMEGEGERNGGRVEKLGKWEVGRRGRTWWRIDGKIEGRGLMRVKKWGGGNGRCVVREGTKRVRECRSGTGQLR